MRPLIPSIRSAVTLLAIAGGALTVACGSSDPATETPAFSHHAHARIGIDCRYCHTSVETTARAGLPPATTCLGCHRGLRRAGQAPVAPPATWRRRVLLPPDIGFDHGAHLGAGIGCATCHGRVDLMDVALPPRPPSMDWCLSCHRDPGRWRRPGDRLTDPTWAPPGASSAPTAATPTLEAPQHCSGCHR